MTVPHHHPSVELVLDYVRGALAAGPRRVVGAHIAACDACADDARLIAAVSGALLEDLPPAPMAQDALERALARIDRPPAPEAAPSAPPGAPGDWIKVAPDVLRAAQERRRWAAPGVWVANLDLDRATGARTYLLGVGPNIAVPRHGHRGHELICVLKGAYHDGDQLHGPGDFADNDETVEHRPKITRDGECVCLIAADHRLAPRDLMGWIFQPLVGI